MAITPLPEHLEVITSMWVGGEEPGGRSRLLDVYVAIGVEHYFTEMGLELTRRSEPVIINTLAKFGGKDFLKLSDDENKTDHLYILGITDFSRPMQNMNVVDEHSQLPIGAQKIEQELGVEITQVVSPLHTKENWTTAIRRCNPKLISISGEMTKDPPIPEGYVTLDAGAYIRADYLSAICPYLSPHSRLVLKAVEEGIYKPQSTIATAKPADPKPEG